MREVLETIMITLFAMLTVVINLLVLQFFYEAVNHLSIETIIAMFLIGSTTILLDSVVALAVLDLKEDK